MGGWVGRGNVSCESNFDAPVGVCEAGHLAERGSGGAVLVEVEEGVFDGVGVWDVRRNRGLLGAGAGAEGKDVGRVVWGVFLGGWVGLGGGDG